jgi:mannose-1-phosphate guanylyltransferase/phosphomannomutase
MPVADVPLIDRIVRHLKDYGIESIAITLSYHADMIIEELTKSFDYDFRFFIEQSPLGTAGGVRAAAADFVEPFLVVSGDALTDFSIAEMRQAHNALRADMTMAVTHVSDTAQYGVVMPGDGNRIRGFWEKPAAGACASDLINCGIYIINPRVLQMIPETGTYDFSRDLFPAMLNRGMSLFYHDIGGSYWTDIGSVSSYFRANDDILGGKCRGRQNTGYNTFYPV